MPTNEGASSAEALAVWEAVIEELTNTRDVVAAKMFGMPSLRHRDGKFFAGLRGDTMTFKLAGAVLDEALALPGAQRFDPSGRRPLKQWVQVPVEASAQWMRLAQAASETPA